MSTTLSSSSSSSSDVDRLTNLTDDLLSIILSKLPTKDVAATQVLSKRMSRALSLITSIHLDAFPDSHPHPHYPRLLDHFPLFVNNVLDNISRPLTCFRLCVYKIVDFNVYLTHVEPTRLHSWISYPLTHTGLKELDLTFDLQNPSAFNLPPRIFACPSLEVLRIVSILAIDNSSSDYLICLPKLRLLYLQSFTFLDDDFVSRLVSSCPVLEDLSIIDSVWLKSDHLTISSHSLLSLILDVINCNEQKVFDLVTIDTPKLEYLWYNSDLPHRFSVAHFTALRKADLVIGNNLFTAGDDPKVPFCTQLSLLRRLCDVPHLCLSGLSTEVIDMGQELRDRLPVFRNVTTLELGAFLDEYRRWDTVLLLMLHRSPLLQTLVFPMGLVHFPTTPQGLGVPYEEAEGWRTKNQTTPSCCKNHLKRIEFTSICEGVFRELGMIRFLLKKASVLEEFVLSKKYSHSCEVEFDRLVSIVKELPRASNSCLITVQTHE